MKVNLNYFYVLLGQGSNYLFPLLIYPFLISKMGLKSFGTFSLYVVITQFIVIIIEYGLAYSSANKISNLDGSQKTEYFCNVLGAKIIIFFIICIFFSAFFVLLNNDLKIIVLYSLCAGLFTVFNPIWFFQATSNYKKLAIVSVLSKVITVLLIWWLIDNNDLFLAMGIFLLQYLLMSLIGFFYLKGFGLYFSGFDFQKSIKILKNSSSFFFSNLAISIYTLVTPIVLGITAMKVEIATYNAISVIKQGLGGVVTPLVQVIYSNIIQNKLMDLERKKFHKHIKKKILFLMSMVGIVGVIGVIFSKQISLFIFGYSNKEIVYSIIITCITPVFIAFNTSFSTFCFLALGKTDVLFSIVRNISFLCLLFAYPVSKNWGAVGVITLLFIVEILIGMIMLLVYRKELKLGV